MEERMLIAVSISSLAKSLEGPIPVKRKSVLVCNSFERSIRSSKEQATVPRSIRLIWPLFTFTRYASSSWVRLRTFRRLLTRWPNSFILNIMKVLSAGCGGWGHFTVGQFTGFSQRKKDALKEKVTDTFPSENGKQYKYPRPLMHLRLSICFYSDESKALETCQKRKTSCGSLQGSDSCRISISHEGLTKVLWISHKSHIGSFLSYLGNLLKNFMSHESLLNISWRSYENYSQLSPNEVHNSLYSSVVRCCFANWYSFEANSSIPWTLREWISQ